MKSTQLLSVVFSLIMFTGVTAGNAAFAESDEVDDILEEFCELSIAEQDEVLSEYGLEEYADDFAEICAMDDSEERDESLDALVDEIELEVFDETDDYDVEDNVYVDDDVYETEDYDDDYANDGTRHNIEDRLANFCEMSEDETAEFFEHHPRLAQFEDRLANYCDLSDYAKNSKLKDFIRQNITDEDHKQVRDYVKDHMKEKYDDSDIDEKFRGKLAMWCEMTDDEKDAAAIEHDKTEDHVDRANLYCTLDESDRTDFIAEHRDEFRAHMKDKMMDKAHDKHHKMDYEKMCSLTDSERATEIDDAEKLERLSKWCDMSPEEREEYKKEHHGEMKDKKHEKMMDKAHDKKHDMKMSDKSEKLKAMIADKRDISDEKRAEIKAKYMEKYGELSDEQKSDLKKKFKHHMASKKVSMSEDMRSSIHERLAEMKAFKAELRENASELTDEEKQELREEFIEKAKDMQLAWINPRIQMTAGVVAEDVECREGFSLVMKASNGVAMCLKADTALKMIDRGIVVPAN